MCDNKPSINRNQVYFMRISDIDVDAIIANARQQLKDDPSVSPSLRSTFEILLLIIPILSGRVSTNSRNSSKPPSQDPNRVKKERDKSDRKPGGQQGRIGTTLEPSDDPDEIKVVTVARRTLPRGHTFKPAGIDTDKQNLSITCTFPPG